MKIRVLVWGLCAVFLAMSTQVIAEESGRSKQTKFCGVVVEIAKLPRSRGMLYYVVDKNPKYFVRLRTDKPLGLGNSQADARGEHVFAIRDPRDYFSEDISREIGKKYGFVFVQESEASKLILGDC